MCPSGSIATRGAPRSRADARRVMSWRKLGRIYRPSSSRPWRQGFGANPIAEHIAGDQFRVYFSARDAENRSSITFIEFDLNRPNDILREADAPVLAPGDLAMFDDSGASIGCIVPVDGKRYLYYMGWHLTVTVPWQNRLGLAISAGPGEPFRRVSRFPIMELDETDPYTISYPWVTRENGRFRMWYGSNLAWGAKKSDMRHVLRYAESADGISWIRGEVIINFENSAEYAICKPCVVRDAGEWRMWFCSRGETYRIRSAVSSDGRSWTRTSLAADMSEIDVS
ncbi:MAG: hypothetical protein ABI565_06345, partial [Vicinamibacteria bacterium]